MADAPNPEHKPANFLRHIVEHDLAQGTNASRRWSGKPASGPEQQAGQPDPAKIRTRFPPEPNGYLHFGHAKSILLNFGLARDYGGVCHMRFDDTNPEKEEQEYVDAILDSVKWLGCSWDAFGQSHLFHASDYFDFMVQAAEALIQAGHAYVDSQSAEEMRANRGTLTEAGKDSPYRSRNPAENLDLFKRMQAGEFPDGAHILRAKIDMAAPNINLRDPAIFRIRHATHHRTGDRFCVYPMYTYAHPIEDALENITHSICTLEFEDQRPFYDWVLEHIWELLRKDATDEAKNYFHSLLASWTKNASVSGTDTYLELLLAKVWAISDDPEFQHLASPLSAREGHMKPSFSGFQSQFAKVSKVSELGQLLRRITNLNTSDIDPSVWSTFVECLFKERWPVLFSVIDEINGILKPLRTPGDEELSLLASCRLPRQYEFSRLNLTYVVLSKRKLIQLVEEKHVEGWDDPRMPTLVGARRRGFTPEGFQLFAERIGVTKSDSLIDMSVLEDCMRETLNESAPRRIAVLDPVKLILDNVPEDHEEWCEAPNHPQKPELGKRPVPFSRELWIEREDFVEEPPKGFFRLSPPGVTPAGDPRPGSMVRLRYGFVIKCVGCDKDAQGNIIAVHAELQPDSKSGTPGADNYKVKGNIHWLSAKHAYPCDVRLYDRLFSVPAPGARREGDAEGLERDFLDDLNPHSKQVISAQLEPSLKDAKPEDRFQFERHGYFVADRKDSKPGAPVFNRTVTLKDSWAKGGK